ncbi:MAG: hypothetical protein C0594_13065 [Marinilabiliales bacterium]|nr:MAG: hypothetical protein C0594_13065 [Marinilabiliales bacterium]
MLDIGELLILKDTDSTLQIELEANKIVEAYLDEVQDSSDVYKFRELQASIFNNIGYIYNRYGHNQKALNYYKKSLEIRQLNGDSNGVAVLLNNIAAIYFGQGDMTSTLQYYTEALRISEKLGDKYKIAMAYNNLGYIYSNQGDYVKALEYFENSYEIRKELGEKRGMASALINIGYIYHTEGKMDKAMHNFKEGLTIQEEIGDKRGITASLINIGSIYYMQNQIQDALDMFNRSLQIQEETGDKHGMIKSMYNLARIYKRKKNHSMFKRYAEKSYKLSKEIGYPEDIELAALLMKELMVLKNNYKKAFEYYQEEVAMRDSVQNETNYRKIQKQQARYEYEKQKAIDSLAHAHEMHVKDIELAKQQEETKKKEAQNQKQRVIIISFSIVIVLILVFFIILFRLLIQKKRINKQLESHNIEIRQMNKEILIQKDQIQNQKEEIEDSINYAKRIQSAVLPSVSNTNELLGDHFIIFRPCSVVSGDFYWTTKQDQLLVVAVADCTGHGVPGAFMSMLGISFLNEIVRKQGVISASAILNNLRLSIIDALKQTGEEGTQRDGIDMSLAVIHRETNLCNWSGAYNPLWIVRSDSKLEKFPDLANMVYEMKGDKMPVAIHDKMNDFTNHVIQLSEKDRIYLFSDGFPDQFGGQNGKKFKSKSFKRLIAETSNLSIVEQGKELEKAFDSWRNYDGKDYAQTDDVTVIGLEI